MALPSSEAGPGGEGHAHAALAAPGPHGPRRAHPESLSGALPGHPDVHPLLKALLRASEVCQEPYDPAFTPPEGRARPRLPQAMIGRQEGLESVAEDSPLEKGTSTWDPGAAPATAGLCDQFLCQGFLYLKIQRLSFWGVPP